MDLTTLNRLEKVNQLCLTDEEKEAVLSFFEKAEEDITKLEAVDTENTERMVHVMPMTNIIREDVAKQNFTRQQLQENAPEADDGYWQVPRLVE